MVLGYIALGLIAGFICFVIVLGVGASFWTALLGYSLVGSFSTLVSSLVLGGKGTGLQPVSADLPEEDRLDLSAPAPKSERPDVQAVATVADMRILAVDDDPYILELLPKIAAMAGCANVTTAGSGSKALELIRRAAQPFDCILLDINMPEMDGIDLCARIRSLPLYRDNPIIMLTAMTDMDHLDRAFRAGASDYTAKPFDVIEFGDRLQVAWTHIAVQRDAAAKMIAQRDVATARLVPLAGVPALIEPTALGNYVARLSGSALAETYVISVAIDSFVAGGDADPDAVLTALSQVALAVDGVIGLQSYVMANVAHGCFVIVANSITLPDAAEVEVAVQDRIDRQRVRANMQRGAPITISIGLAVRPSGAKAGRARVAFEHAMASAKTRVADKRSGTGFPVHRWSGR